MNMKVAIILAIALAVILEVHEADAGCASKCKAVCRRRRCAGYDWVLWGGRCYCICSRCAIDHTMKFLKNEGSSEMFPHMNDNKDTDFFHDMP
ncbi:uncharacterized protein LOC127708554 [Mytilus californianus]|uniref:uncharacterized protein LOC127708554 n=1 Tax=Mytilus californianus TaxID=6549 RepID=UPI0022478E4C|nr:uncharacterized protein LOC127708554 [Mytilus californianus]